MLLLLVNDVLSFTKKFKWGSKNHKSGKAAVTKRASCKDYASKTCYEIFRGLDTLQSVQNSNKFSGRHSGDGFKISGHFDSRCNHMRKLEIGTVGWLLVRSFYL